MSHRTSGSAGSGVMEWLWQRLTALYLAAFGIVLLIDLLLHPVHDYVAWLRLFHHPVLRVLWLLGFVALLVHAWIGIRSVYMDYLHGFGVRFVVTLLTGTALLVCGSWVVLILFRSGG